MAYKHVRGVNTNYLKDPTKCEQQHPTHVVLDYIKELAKLEPMSKPARNIPLQFLLQVPALISCPDSPQ